jgi:hypothetical protein
MRCNKCKAVARVQEEATNILHSMLKVALQGTSYAMGLVNSCQLHLVKIVQLLIVFVLFYVSDMAR